MFDKNGQRIASKRRYSDKMMTFLLRAYLRKRLAQPASVAASVAPADPIIEKIDALEPVVPANPHRLTPPDELAAMIARDFTNCSGLERYEVERAARKRATD